MSEESLQQDNRSKTDRDVDEKIAILQKAEIQEQISKHITRNTFIFGGLNIIGILLIFGSFMYFVLITMPNISADIAEREVRRLIKDRISSVDSLAQNSLQRVLEIRAKYENLLRSYENDDKRQKEISDKIEYLLVLIDSAEQRTEDLNEKADKLSVLLARIGDRKFIEELQWINKILEDPNGSQVPNIMRKLTAYENRLVDINSRLNALVSKEAADSVAAPRQVSISTRVERISDEEVLPSDRMDKTFRKEIDLGESDLCLATFTSQESEGKICACGTQQTSQFIDSSISGSKPTWSGVSMAILTRPFRDGIDTDPCRCEFRCVDIESDQSSVAAN